MWLLDSSTLIDLCRGEVATQATLEEVAQDGLASSVLCLFEAWRSLARVSAGDAERAVTALLQHIEWLPLSEEAAARAARLSIELHAAGTPAPSVDLLIAATALEHGAGVITEDADFDLIPGLTLRGTRD